MEGSAVYLSFARLGASRPPQDVQVETRLSLGGEAAALFARCRTNGEVNPGDESFEKRKMRGSILFRRKINQPLTSRMFIIFCSFPSLDETRLMGGAGQHTVHQHIYDLFRFNIEVF